MSLFFFFLFENTLKKKLFSIIFFLAKCLEPRPTGRGMCRMMWRGFYYNSESKKCDEFQTTCRANGNNNFVTLEACEAECLAN